MKIRFISALILLLFASCSPSPAMVQTAIAQTEKAKPTYIPRPTVVSTATPTSPSTLEPDYTQLVFQDPFTWPDDVKSKFPGIFSGRFDSSTIQAFNYFLETIWGQVLNLDAETIRSYDPFQLVLLAKDYAKKEGELEIALPTSWRDALINKPTNYLSVIHKTGEVGPDSQEISSGSGDYLFPGFYAAGIKNGYAIGYFFVPSYGDQKAKLYYMATYGITGKLSLLFFIPGVSSVIAEEGSVQDKK